MSQSGYTPILIYGSSTASNVPLAANLTTSASGVELAINAADGKLFYKDSAGVVQVLASKAGNVNVASFQTSLGGLTPSTATTGVVTLAGTLNTSSGGTGLTSYTAGDLSYYASGTALSKLAIGTSGQILTSSGTAPQWSTLSGVAVTTFSAGTTGFTPSSATSGAITLAGTLATTNGGTGLTSFTANGVVYASSTSALATGSALTFDGTNLGISNAAPSFNLDIGNTSATSNFTQRIVSGASYAAMSRYDLSGTGTFTVGFNNSGSVVNNAPSGVASLWMQQNYPLVFGVNGSEQMRLTSTGLGIGTSSPSYKLQIVGGNATGFLLDNGGQQFTQLLIQRNGTANTGGDILVDGTNSTFSIRSLLAGPMIFSTSATAGGATERARIDSAGNLGLGVTPSAWSVGKALQIGSTTSVLNDGSSNTYYGNNFYYNGAFRYTTSNAANSYIQYSSGAHSWNIAPSGTAGNTITFTQAMTLDASGNLLVGQTSPSQTTLGFGVSGSGGTYPTGTVSTVMAGSTSASTTWNTYSTGAAAYRFYVDMGGTVHATSIVITAISDQRLKENVRDIDTGLSAIMALKPRRFDWKEGKGQDKKDAAGFIAQEFETVFPECVSTSKAGGDGIEYKNINHETLIPTLVKAIQEQQALIESLTTRLAAAGI